MRQHEHEQDEGYALLAFILLMMYVIAM